MSVRNELLALWLALALIAGCTADDAAPDPSAPLSDEDRSALQRFADDDCTILMAADWDALAAGYADDAVRLPPNALPIHGRVAIRNSLNHVPPITACEFQSEQLDGNAQVAFMRASYDMTLSPPDAEPIRDVGKILIVFRKQGDGTWVRVADAWNSDGQLP